MGRFLPASGRPEYGVDSRDADPTEEPRAHSSQVGRPRRPSADRSALLFASRRPAGHDARSAVRAPGRPDVGHATAGRQSIANGPSGVPSAIRARFRSLPELSDETHVRHSLPPGGHVQNGSADRCQRRCRLTTPVDELIN